MLGRKAVGELREQATTWGSWPGEVSGTWSGMPVDRNKSLQLLAVYGSVRMISDGISTMPIDVFQRRANDVPKPIQTPAWLDEPMVDIPFSEWCSQVLTSLLLDGNSYIAVMRNDRGAIVELVPLGNDTVRVVRQSGRKVYLVNGSPFAGELLHIKGMMIAGSDVGLSPIEYARQTIGLGLAAEKFGAQFFDGPGMMPGVIEMVKPAQPGIMAETAKAWQKFRKQGGMGLPGVLQDGATWKPTGVTNEEAQFLATRQWSAAEIAAQMFLLDPNELGIPIQGTSHTYANLEQRETRKVRTTFLPWMIRIERALSALLFNPRYMKFNPSSLLRGDLLTQYQAFAIGLGGLPFLDVDEVREKIDLGPMAEASPGLVAADVPQTNSATFAGESRGQTFVVSPNIEVHIPAQTRQAAPIVNVAVPDVRVPAPHVDVHVAAPQVDVHVPAPQRPGEVRKRVVRDSDGRISHMVEEPT